MTTPLGHVNPDSGLIEVGDNRFGCSFFPGHLFPVFFTLGGRPLPPVRFADCATVGGFVYHAYEERWAEQTVVRNTAERFAICCRGVFCRSDTPKFVEALPGVAVTLRYHLRRGVPEIGVEIEVKTTLPEPPELVLNHPVWRLTGADAAQAEAGFRLAHTAYTVRAAEFKVKTKLKPELI